MEANYAEGGGSFLSALRVRVAVALVSGAGIALELVLIRILALRFWHHFAFMVISIALLGVGASGTLLTLLRSRVRLCCREWLWGTAILFSVSVWSCVFLGLKVPLNLQFLPWSIARGFGYVLLLELILLVPLLLTGLVIGIALLDRADRVSVHYGWNLIGCGCGALATVLLLWWFHPQQLLIVVSLAGWIAALVVCPRSRIKTLATLAVGVMSTLPVFWLPKDTPMSQYKILPQLQEMAGVESVVTCSGPLGKIDVVRGGPVHFAPGLSLNFTGTVPAHALLITDGDLVTPVYQAATVEDWAFLDHSTQALPYHLTPAAKTAIIGAGGGADIGLALLHGSPAVTALEMNPQVVSLMRGPLHDIGGDIYDQAGVHVHAVEARGFFAKTKEKFDVIQLSAGGAFGAAGAGLYSAQESYLYTLESFAGLYAALTPRGMICVTGWDRAPPRDGPRLFNLARAMLEDRGANPSAHLALIRSWVTFSLLISATPLDGETVTAVREFCDDRGFDLCYVPGIREAESNRFHLLDEPTYYELSQDLLSRERDELLENYLFQLSETTDDRPFFYHFFRWRALPVLWRQLGAQARAHLETGYLMIVMSLVQAMILSLLLVLGPLLTVCGGLRAVSGKVRTFGYFLCIGVGYMLLEISFLQKLILYLAQPIYSVSICIAGFLVFSGLGSQASQRWQDHSRRTVGVAVLTIVLLLLVITRFGDRWFALTLSAPIGWRCLIALVSIAPLAFAMGHMFPLGLVGVRQTNDLLIPWAWAVNGCASVVATVAAPLLAMATGFQAVTLLAGGFYLVAWLCFMGRDM